MRYFKNNNREISRNRAVIVSCLFAVPGIFFTRIGCKVKIIALSHAIKCLPFVRNRMRKKIRIDTKVCIMRSVK